MSARAVEAAGVPFAPAGDELHDADVALDEIASFTGNVEPVVLRVAARGGWPAERRAVEGDWLCADHEPPKRVQRPAWNVGREGRRWAAGRPWLDAWESCQRGDWMIYAAVSHRLGLRLAAAAVCACVEPSARFLLRRHERSFAEAIRGVRDLAAGRRAHVPLQRSLSVLYSASTRIRSLSLLQMIKKNSPSPTQTFTPTLRKLKTSLVDTDTAKKKSLAKWKRWAGSNSYLVRRSPRPQAANQSYFIYLPKRQVEETCVLVEQYLPNLGPKTPSVARGGEL
jgi:hypothetical protein